MNEKEMIEEMAKVIDDRLIEANNYLGSMNKGNGYWIAQKLVEHYQPKIPEGSVVLDRQEHQKYCSYKIIEPQIKGCLDRERELERKLKELEEQRDRQAYIAEELIQEKHRWTEQARKETAKEILETILEESGIDILENFYKLPTRIFNKIKAKFGVEV